ncbi:MAG TPA: hypothetical protein VK348_00705 [Planctomycetota bacterium]|nr:hypothetical protein [Planctomycetota bacterium]
MAVPNPQHELERVRQLAKKGLPAVVVVCGAGAYFRGEAITALLAAVPADAELRTVDGQQVPLRGLAAADGDSGGDDPGGEEPVIAGTLETPASCPELEVLRGGGLFARRGFLCVRRGERWLRCYGAALQAFLPRIAAGCGLLLETQKLDKRTRLAKELLAAGPVFEFRELYDSPFDRTRSPLEAELVQWLVDRSRSLGVALQPETAFVLLAQVGKSPAELLAELGRLRDQLGADPARRPLAPDDVRGRLSCGFESTPFEFAEAVLAGDRRRAVRSLRAMFDHGVKSRDGRAMDQGGVFPFITSWLFQSLALVHEGRLLLDSGTSARDLAGKLGVNNFGDRFTEQVRNNPLPRLRHGLLALLHCQRMLRLSSEEPVVLLERFVAQWFDGVPVPTARELEW